MSKKKSDRHIPLPNRPGETARAYKARLDAADPPREIVVEPRTPGRVSIEQIIEGFERQLRAQQDRIDILEVAKLSLAGRVEQVERELSRVGNQVFRDRGGFNKPAQPAPPAGSKGT
jgi:hypothetical protein